MGAFEAVDITSPAFASRLANLLVATRTRNGLGVGSVARSSEGRFAKADLKAFERGDRVLDETTLDDLASLYRCDLGAILPSRLPVEVSAHRISAGGVHQDFESTTADAVLAAYLTRVGTLRRQRNAAVIDLRRDDVEALSGFLHESSESIVHRLATLMHATQTKRTAMIGVLATGAAVIGLVGTALAVNGTASSPADTVPGTGVATSTSVATTETGVAPTDSAVVTTDSLVAATTVAPVTASTTPPVTGTTVRPRTPPSTVAATTSTQPASIETNLTTIVADGPPPVPTPPPSP